MARQLVKRTAEYRVYRRRDDRYAVTGPDKKPINGDDKVAILLAEGLIAAPAEKQPEPEAPAEKAAADGTPDAEAGEAAVGDA